MAKLNKGLLGPSGISGRLGNLIYYSWRGKQCVRTRPRKRSDNSSEAQIIQQERFNVVSRGLQPFIPVIPLGFYPRGQMTAYNHASSYAFKHALTGEFPHFRFDYSKMLCSHGSLPQAFRPVAACMGHESIRFSWEYKNWGGPLLNDRALLVAVCEDPLLCFFTYTAAVRRDETGFLHAPGMAGKKLHTYIGFINASGKKAADSVYTGELTLAP